MTNKQKADLVAWMHLTILLFGIVSLPLLFIVSWWSVVIFVLSAFSIFSWIIYRGECWITYLENKYRKQTGDHYGSGFIKYYLNKFFLIDTSEAIIDILLYSYTLTLFVVAIIKYFY